MLRRYEVGKASPVNGDDVVIGHGTSWLTYAAPGDVFNCDGAAAAVAEVLAVDRLRLASPWPGADASGAAYFLDKE